MKKKDIIYDAAFYIRLSCEDGDKEESDSVGNQRKLLQEYIEKHEEFSLYDTYVDDGFSGTNFARPEFRRMIEDIKKRKINCVIVKDLSRFGRDYIETGKYLERKFPEWGVRFISVSDGIDSLKHVYDMMLPIKNIFNEQYARDISKKIHATVTTKQKAGEFIGAFASYGYNKSPQNKNALVVDEYAASVVRRIFDMYIQGYGKQKIARILTQEGILCPSAYKRLNGDNYNNHNYKDDTHWTYSTVNSILHKEIYTGNMVQGTKYQQMRGHQKRVEKDQWIVVENTHEPIISKDIWDKAQSLLSKRTREMDLETNQSIFAGFLKCGTCGRPMAKVTWKRADGTKKSCMYCGTYKRFGNKYCTPHTLPVDVLEQIILDDLEKIVQTIESVEQIVTEEVMAVPKKPDCRQKHLSKLSEELNRVRKLKKSVYEDYKEELLSKEEYLAYRKDYMKKEADISKQIEALSKTAPGEEQNFFDNPWIDKLLLLKGIKTLDRSIIVEMISEIIVYEDRKIKIIYNFSDELGYLFSKEIKVRN